MDLNDSFLVVVRWVHLLSATAWVGGSIFYLLVLRPARQKSESNAGALMAAMADEFRALVNLCIVALVATGVILALNRLTFEEIGAPYAITLGAKAVLTVWMFLLVRQRRTYARLVEAYLGKPEPEATGIRRFGQSLSGYNAVLVLGVIVFLLSDLLGALFEAAIGE